MRTLKISIALLLCLALSTTDASGQVGYVWGKVLLSPTYGDFGLDVECDDAGNILACGDYKDNCNIGGTNYPSLGSTDMYLSKQGPDGSYEWVTVDGSATTDRQFALRIAQDGSIYTCGYGLVVFPANRTQHQWDALTVKYNPSGSLAWGRAMNGDIYSESRDIAVDAAGNNYTVGFLKTIGWWGNDTLVGNGAEDAYVVKFDSSGVYQWSSAFGGTSDDQGYAVDVDASGNIWVGGNFQSLANFGGTFLPTSGGKDAFILKMNPQGNVLFVKQFKGIANAEVIRLRISEDGDCYFTGNFSDTLRVGSQRLTAVDAADIFYGKMRNDGSVAWARSAGGQDFDFPQDIAVDDEENVYIGGYYFGNLTWQSSTVTSAGFDDSFFAKTDSNGVLLLLESSHYANESRDVFGVAADPAQNIIITGKFAQRIEFGTDTFYSQNNSSDSYIAKYATRTQSIKWLGLDGSPFCSGDNFQVDFKVYGNFEQGNFFVVELSDASGSFSNPVAVDSIQGVYGGTIACTVPGGISNGSGYRMRIRSTLPQVLSNDNGNNLSLSSTTAIPVQIMGDTVLCNGSPIILSVAQGFSNQLWSNGDTSYFTIVHQPGIVGVDATDPNGCSNSDQVEVIECVSLPEPMILKAKVIPQPCNAEACFLDWELETPGPVPFRLFAANGQMVKAGRLDGGDRNIQLPSQGLSQGLYFLNMEIGGKLHSLKVLIQ